MSFCLRVSGHCTFRISARGKHRLGNEVNVLPHNDVAQDGAPLFSKGSPMLVLCMVINY